MPPHNKLEENLVNIEDIKNKICVALPPDGLGILQQVFLQTKNRDEGVVTNTFRAEFVDKRKTMDELERSYFLVKENDFKQRKEVYRLRRIALPILGIARADKLLECAKRTLPLLAEAWRRNGDHSLKLSEVLNMLGGDKEDVIEAIRYFDDIPGFSPGRFDFAVNEDPPLLIYEQLWDHQTLEDILENDLKNIARSIAHYQMPELYSIEHEQITPSIYEHIETELLRKWIDQLPAPMPKLLRETEKAFKSGLILLPCMGLRALLDIACQNKTKSGVGFEQAVKELYVERKLISETERKYLLAIYDFGSAVQHRGHEPTQEEIARALKVGVSLLRNLYDLEDEVETIKKTTPHRPGAK